MGTPTIFNKTENICIVLVVPKMGTTTSLE